MQFGVFKNIVNPTIRVSVCRKETLCYENYDSIYSVPDSYNSMYVYGFGPVDAEFNEICKDEQKRMTFDVALEIMVSDNQENDADDILDFANIRKLHSRIDPLSIHIVGEDGRRIYQFTRDVLERYDNSKVLSIGLDFSDKILRVRDHAFLLEKLIKDTDTDAEMVIPQVLDLSRGTVVILEEE